ncbi:sensor domain-containing diguanylate cyclase [Thermohalobacter berrensis]|uniref:Diguanylate cyclase n=1 Tax=Thermohalobacter berrensis TaxID=99594 RepID=A0A419T6C3_9FIRM|nr:diguanylate cyclase [Thermohalobacter berrensis]RKD32976.1 hypothetical protein BET03_10195 [Thermohalobacter berrensis]
MKGNFPKEFFSYAKRNKVLPLFIIGQLLLITLCIIHKDKNIILFSVFTIFILELFLLYSFIRDKKLNSFSKEDGQDIYNISSEFSPLESEEDKFQSFLENCPSSIFLIQKDKIIYANPRTVQLTGYTLDELYRKKWEDLISDEMKGFVRKKLSNKFWKNNALKNIIKIKTKSGKNYWVNFTANKIMYNGQEAIIVNAYDVTDQKRAQDQLDRLIKLKDSMLKITQSIIGVDNIKALYHLILEKALEVIDHARVGSILILDENKKLIPAAYKGYDPEKMENFNLKLDESFLWIKSGGKVDRTIIINDVKALKDTKVLEFSANPENWSIGSTISAPIIIHGKLYGMLNIDSERKNAFTEDDRLMLDYFRSQIEVALKKHLLYKEIIKLSRYDQLTNVYNRRYFEELFKKHLKEKSKEKFSLVLFDLNGLKPINDKFGHLSGDKLIKKFSNHLKKNMCDYDLLARYGGDEFIAVFFNISYEKLERKLESLLKSFHECPIKIENEKIICSFSYGIANYPEDGKTYKELVNIADKRMYDYKFKMKSEKQAINI